MRLALADVKKAITRRAGEVYVAPRLLRPREHVRALAALIALHEEHTGRSRAAFPADRPAELVGDYRMARCLVTTLGEWYAWESPAWPGLASDAESEALAAAGIASPVDLRLALYDAANASGRGYLPAAERERALDAFAASLGSSPPGHPSLRGEREAEEEVTRAPPLQIHSEGEPASGISRDTLNALLALDREERAVLRRIALQPPTPAQLAARYNQLALEALLSAAATVEWVLPATPNDRGARSAALKRVCFLARRMGVHYDVAFEEGAGSAEDAETRGGRGEERVTIEETEGTEGRAEGETAEISEEHGGDAEVAARVSTFSPSFSSSLTSLTSVSSVVNSSASPGEGEDLLVAERPALYVVPSASGGELPARALHVTLYGPQEVMGAANQYGERLARLCRALLGYRHPDGRSVLGGEGLRGSARVYLHGRPLTFPLDDSLLALLDLDATEAGGVGAHGMRPEVTEQFDSALEERLFAEFVALERAGEAHGWHVEREPEPVVAGETIYLPDFAFTRGPRRVLLELAGYWRPEYRERKVRKLLALRGRMRLVVAAPAAAREAFAALEGAYPLLLYGARPSATALLALLDREYDDASERLAAVDWRAALERVETAGRLTPAGAMALLSVYARAELPAALDRLTSAAVSAGRDAPEWIAALGLCTPAWREAALARLAAAVGFAPEGRLSLRALGEQIARDDRALASLDDDAVEALARLAGLSVRRDSIFAVEVLAPGGSGQDESDVSPHERVTQPRKAAPQAHRAQPTPRASRKVHDVSHKPQSLFADPEPGGAGEDAPDPTKSYKS